MNLESESETESRKAKVEAKQQLLEFTGSKSWVELAKNFMVPLDKARQLVGSIGKVWQYITCAATCARRHNFGHRSPRDSHFILTCRRLHPLEEKLFFRVSRSSVERLVMCHMLDLLAG